MAAARMRGEIEQRTSAERAAIRDSALRWLISTLVRLAWSSTTFADAVRALAMLAEVEKASYSSGASAEFVHRFRLYLSGTAVPYRDRIPILDELLASDSSVLKRLAVRALAQVGDRHGFRTHRPPIARGVPEEEWEPGTEGDYIDSFLLGVERLNRCVLASDASLAQVIGETVPNFATFLVAGEPLRSAVINLFLATAQAFPQHRDELRMRASGRLNQARKFKKDLSPDATADIEALVARLRDNTPSGRLRELLGPGPEDRDGLEQLARDVAADPELLRREWEWLTGGEPRKVWSFGTALGAFNTDELVAELIRSPGMGGDGRVACAYLERRAASEGLAWLDNWLEEFTARASDRGDFVLEATWRLTPTTVGARRVERVLARGNLRPASVAQFAYAGWDEKLDIDALEVAITALARHEDGVRAACSMLRTRLEKHPEEFDRWEPISLELTTRGDVIRDRQDDGREWAELAKRLVSGHAMALFAAILREQNVRDGGAAWFLEHSNAAEIAFECVEREPATAWEILCGFLDQDYAGAYPFLVGFPEGLIDRMDHGAILTWVAKNPRYRAPLLAQVVLTGFADDSLAAALVDAYGAIDEVSSAFQARLSSGTWNGPISNHWASTAAFLCEIASRTTRAGLRRWAADAAAEFERMAARDKAREEEDELRNRY